LDVSDRIELGLSAAGDVAASFDAFRDHVLGETLAIVVADAPLDGDAFRHDVDIDGQAVGISLRKVSSPNA
jgi:hypothetical protein